MKKIFILALFIAGCEIIPEIPYQPEWNVFIVLRNNRRSIAVLDRTHRMEDDIFNVGKINMEIVLENTDTFRFEFDSLGMYSVDTVPVIPGGIYTLYLNSPGLGELHGYMEMPDSFSIIYPPDGCTLTASDSIIIGSIRGIKRFRLVAFFEGDSSAYTDFISDVVNDTVMKLPLYFMTFADTGRYKIEIWGMDKNYSDYPLNYYYLNSTEDRRGIDCGVGVFCGVFIETLTIYFH